MPEVFGPGTHVCVLYGSPEEQASIAARYLTDGLLAHERCFYIVQSAEAQRRVREAIDMLDVDADEAVRRRDLLELTFDQYYLVDGFFDVDRALDRIRTEVDLALDEGYAGVRGCGDMSWLLREAPGSQQVFEYEARINDLLRGRPAQAMCQYDWRLLPAPTIRRALMTHPLSISGH